jgi:GDP-D-mannose dehydratase
MCKAIVTGITGQDGAYLADYFCRKVMLCMVHFVELLQSISGE